MRDFIERLQQKPEHARRQIALVTAGGLTAVVTLGWGIAFLSSGALALNPVPASAGSLAQASDVKGAISDTRSSFSDLLGAVMGSSEASATPALTIVDTQTSSTLDARQQSTADDRTVIPF